MACFEFILENVPGGIYNLTNSGYVSTREIINIIKKYLKPSWNPVFWSGDDEFYRFGATTPRSNCILETAKPLNKKYKMRPVQEAIEDAVKNWIT